MYQPIANNVVVSNGSGFNAVQTTEAVPLDGAAYVTIQVTCTGLTAATGSPKFKVTVEASEDGATWRAIDASASGDVGVRPVLVTTAPSFANSGSVLNTGGSYTTTPLTFGFVRLRYDVYDGTDTVAIFSAGIAVSRT